MGEVVVSYEDGLNVNEERENEEKRVSKEGGSNSMVKWEKFLPKMALRVLLVEADDSTRQIIGALLRKCSYKVASVPDGLKAWEVLKARPHNIDLILTEVELPSISGYALLTLIMEHEVCKNIPVIMMSSHDSVSTVYKCMLRGASYFLVKPIRINELKNLWQHVWRRQTMRREGLGPQVESVGQQKLEATAENNATSDHSSSSKTRTLRQERIKKGSDAQSSCGKPDLEAESAYVVEIEDHLLPKQGKSPVSELKIQEHSNNDHSAQNLCTPESAVAGSDTAADNDYDTLDRDGKTEQQSRGDNNMNHYAEASNNKEALEDSPREAIDFVGALHKRSKVNSSVNDEANNFESSPELDLSLRRNHFDVHANMTTYENHTLNHSNASAFTRYINKPLCISNANAISGSTGDKMNASDHLSDNVPGSNRDSIRSYDRISLPINLSKEVENEYQTASQRLFPIPLPVRGIRVDVCAAPTAYGSANPSVTPSPSRSPSLSNQQMNSLHQLNLDVVNGRNHYYSFEQSPRISSNQPKQDQKLEYREERTQFSPTTDQSATSAAHLNGFGCGTSGGRSGNFHQDAVVPGGSESGNEQSHAANHDLNCQKSIQREAALNKFRLKRKERCYEKKVRYESRKKLAEQRPRVKGQFVRQVPPDPPPPKSANSGGNSVANEC